MSEKEIKTGDATPDVRTLVLPSHEEYVITTSSGDGEQMQRELLDAARKRDATILGQFIFGGCDHYDGFRRELEGAAWPSSWLHGDACPSGKMLSMQATAIKGLPIEPIVRNGRRIGHYYEDPFARYCRIGGITPPNPQASREAQSRAVFETIKDILATRDMSATQIVRTWLYLDILLDWYDDFNPVRTSFFDENGMFDALVPASTGIGASNPTGTALMVDCLAMQPKSPALTIRAVPSPLQGSARDYRSSFSRAVELSYPTHAALLISGTASIDPDGRTMHEGDAVAQIDQTLQVVEALLVSRGMRWKDVTRGIVYFKDMEDLPKFQAHCSAHGIPRLPLALSHADVCRHDLLFELEVDAVKKAAST